jgi:DNA-binding XRE family transcriptional regulator
MGKPTFQPTEENRHTVRALAAYGVNQDDIAKVIGIAKKTLIKHFRRELDTAYIEAGAKVSENLFRIATHREHRQKEPTGSVVAAAIWWEKTRLRWSDRTEVAIGNTGNQPFQMRLSDVDAAL